MAHREESSDWTWFEHPGMPEGEVVEAQVLVTLTLDSEGQSGYHMTVRGDRPATSFIGLLEMAKLDLYNDAKENWGQ